MQQEQCPFCKTIVPQGAIVCSGCHAERHVGCSQEELKTFGGMGVVLALLVSYFLSFNAIFFLVAMGLGGILGMTAGFSLNKRKVVWKRMQRTNN